MDRLTERQADGWMGPFEGILFASKIVDVSRARMCNGDAGNGVSSCATSPHTNSIRYCYRWGYARWYFFFFVLHRPPSPSRSFFPPFLLSRFLFFRLPDVILVYIQTMSLIAMSCQRRKRWWWWWWWWWWSRSHWVVFFLSKTWFRLLRCEPTQSGKLPVPWSYANFLLMKWNSGKMELITWWWAQDYTNITIFINFWKY